MGGVTQRRVALFARQLVAAEDRWRWRRTGAGLRVIMQDVMMSARPHSENDIHIERPLYTPSQNTPCDGLYLLSGAVACVTSPTRIAGASPTHSSGRKLKYLAVTGSRNHASAMASAAEVILCEGDDGSVSAA